MCYKKLLSWEDVTLEIAEDAIHEIADATTLTKAGYVGEDAENIIFRLLQNADYNV